MSVSTTRFLEDLKQAKSHADLENARTELWKRTYPRIVEFARKMLDLEDAEEVASDSMMSFFAAFDEGKLPSLSNRENFWKIIQTYTKNGSVSAYRKKTAVTRGGRDRPVSLEQMKESGGDEPTHEVTPSIETEEEFVEFVAMIDGIGNNELLVDICYLRFYEQMSHAQICTQLSISESTLNRKMKLINLKLSRFEAEIKGKSG